MTDISVSAQAPPEQDRVIESWGSLRLVDRGGGDAFVSMPQKGLWIKVASVSYGGYAVTSEVEWNDAGKMALEQFKRDAFDTLIYSAVAKWLRGPR